MYGKSVHYSSDRGYESLRIAQSSAVFALFDPIACVIISRRRKHDVRIQSDTL